MKDPKTNQTHNMAKDTDTSLLIQESEPMEFQELVDMVTRFQDQLQSLDYRVTNKNFGSKLYQTKETINSKSRFIAGAKDEVVIMDAQHPTYRLWAGAEDPSTAPFSVDKFGNLIATSVTLTGYVEDGAAAADVNANTTTISGGKITTNSIDVDKIIAGTLVGFTIKTSDSGARVEMSGANNNINVYDASVKRMALDGDSLEFYNSVGTKTAEINSTGGYSFLIDGSGSSMFGVIRYNSTYGLYMQSATTNVAQFYNGGLAMVNNAVIRAYDIEALNTSAECGTASQPWGSVYTENLYIGIGIDMNNNSIIEVQDITPNDNGNDDCGGLSNEWANVYTVDAEVSDAVDIGPDGHLIMSTGAAVLSDFDPNTTGTYDLGSTSLRWDYIYLVNTPDVSSDENLKENIEDIQSPLEKILSIRPIKFERPAREASTVTREKTYNKTRKNKKTGEIEKYQTKKMKEHKIKASPRTTQYGFSLQQMKTTLPEITSESGIRYMDVIGILVGAVQELEGKVKTLENK